LHILIAEDDPISRRVLEATLLRWGHEVVITTDGQHALETLQRPDAPHLAILDWMMPEIDGLEVCRRLRCNPPGHPYYLILLTARGAKADMVQGLEGGADDFLTKPFDREELRARLHVGIRMVKMQQVLADRVHDLEEALSRLKHLQRLVPICAYCKKVRDDQNYWQQVEHYMTAHTEARFSHGICPDCLEAVVKPELERHRQSQEPPAAVAS
jgi:sigma-B regulation protein RsbU (phosphoserine phosphatase)